ncbi:hypothetical protein MASR2M78_01640 [Treponema sp.]
MSKKNLIQKSSSPSQASQYFISIAWVLAIIALASLLHFGTIPTRNTSIALEIQKALKSAGDNRSLLVSKKRWISDGSLSSAGTRFAFKENSGSVYVFSLQGSGVSASCVAILNKDAHTERLIPLGESSKQDISRIPQSIIRTKLGYIESYERSLLER